MIQSFIKRRCTFYVLSLLLLFGNKLLAQGVAFADTKTKATLTQTTKEKSLIEVLNEFEKMYRINFVYQKKYLVNKTAPPQINYGKDLESSLTKLLAPLNLAFDKVDKNYVILPIEKAKEGRRIETKPADVSTNFAVTVTGSVTSREDGSALPGASVVLKGTTTGVTADSKGSYQLIVPDANSTLVFSFIGFAPQEVALAGRSTVNVSLVADVNELKEMVVIGYGTQEKRDLTGSISTINGKDIATAPVQSFDQAMQGRSAGVNISSPNGALNNPPVIRIRGINSINLSSFPLVVIDGVPTYSDNISTNSAPFNPLANVNPTDIESVEVLKDASATAIYGSRASAGVILITTKQGVKGKVRVNFDSWVSWSSQARKNIQVLGAEDFMTLKNEGRVNAGLAQAYFPTYDAAGKLIDTDWSQYFFQTGLSHSNSLSFSGGSEKTTYYLSTGYTNQQGLVKRNEFDRLIGRVKIDHKLFKNVTVGTNFSFSNTKTRSPNSGSVSGQSGDFANGPRLVLNLDPNIGAYNNDGSYNIGTGGAIGQMNNLVASPFPNLALSMDKDRFLSAGSQIQGNMYASWEIIKNLRIRTQYGIDRLTITDEAYENPLQNPGFAVGGRAVNIYRLNNRWNWQNTVQYDFDLVKKHNFSLLAGTEQQYTTLDRWGVTRTTQSDPFFTSAQGNFVNTIANTDVRGNQIQLQTENFLTSYFGRVNYDYNKKYFATINFRRDGYSAFAKGHKFGNFYGASLGYTVSDEAFWKRTALLNSFSYLKLRASYGLVGNNQGLGDFASLQTYSGGLLGDAATLFYYQAGNSNLSWETSKKLDLGLSFGLLQDRITGEFAYYKNNVDGLILNVPQALSKGVPNPTTANVLPLNIGSMRNTGIELSVRATAIRTANFSWVINANVTTLKNVVTALDGANQRILTPSSSAENVIQIGESVSSLWAVPTLGVNPANGRRLFRKANGTVVQYDHSASSAQRWTTLEGAPTTAVTAQADGVISGPTLPKWYGGFDNTFKYKGFDLGLFIQFSGGNYILNGTKAGLRDQRFFNLSTEMLDRWTPANTEGKLPRLVYGDNISNGGAALSISENIEKADFLRMRNISFGYTVNRDWLTKIQLASARFYVQVQNAFIITGYTGFDPEISVNGNSNTQPGIDRNAIGQARVVSVGVNVGF